MKHEITAKRLKLALESAGILPVELSELSGVSQSSISQYLSGAHAPSNVSSCKMADVLQCSPVWLMGFDVPMERRAPETPASLTPSEQSLIHVYRLLNSSGREKARDYLADLAGNAKYTQEGDAKKGGSSFAC